MPVWFHDGYDVHLGALQPRLRKEGNRYLRKALYMPALGAIKYKCVLMPLRFPTPHRWQT